MATFEKATRSADDGEAPHGGTSRAESQELFGMTLNILVNECDAGFYLLRLFMTNGFSCIRDPND
jgi:hypothetical protein